MKEFYKTVAVVTVFSGIEKFLGFAYRVFLSRSIGSEGVGLYQITLSVFAVLLTLCCSGIPVTVSRLMTKYKAQKQLSRVDKVVTAGISCALAFALPVVLILFFGNGIFSFIFADKRCMSLFLIILPILGFSAIYAVIRGVFWGNKDFLPYSVIELLEEICMIFAGVLLISKATDVFTGAKRAVIAVVISYVFSFITAVAVFFMRGNRLKNPRAEFKPLLSSAMPITAMRTASAFVVSLVSVILPVRLMAGGYTNSQALSEYGSAFGLAMPLLFIPSTLIGGFTLVLIPEISNDFYGNNKLSLRNNVEKAMRFAICLSCIFIPLFAVLGEELGILLYDNFESGRYLSQSAFLMLGMSLSNITTSILNSIGMENKTLAYYAVSACLMLLSIWFLPLIMGIYSLLVGFCFVYYLTAVCNIVLLVKKLGAKFAYKRILFLAVAFILPTGLIGFILKQLLIKPCGTVITVFVCAAVMAAVNAALYLKTKIITVREIRATFTKKTRNG